MSAELSFRSLEIFLAVAETRAMAAAARRLRISPSTISQQIAGLEANLGATLIDRSARPIALTAAGQRLLGHAQRILDGVSSARSDMMDLKLSSLPALRLAIIDGLDLLLTPELMRQLHSLYPDCQLSALSGKTEENLRALLEREVDLIVSADAADYPDSLERHPLLKEALIVVAAPGVYDPNAAGDPKARITALPFVRYTASMPLGRLIETHLRRVRLNLPHQRAFESTRSIFATVLEGGGWALTTPICLLDNPDFSSSLEAYRPPFPNTGRTLSLWARRDELSGLPAQLAELSRGILAETCVAPGLAKMPWLGNGLTTLDEHDRFSGI